MWLNERKAHNLVTYIKYTPELHSSDHETKAASKHLG